MLNISYYGKSAHKILLTSSHHQHEYHLHYRVANLFIVRGHGELSAERRGAHKTEKTMAKVVVGDQVNEFLLFLLMFSIYGKRGTTFHHDRQHPQQGMQATSTTQAPDLGAPIVSLSAFYPALHALRD